MPIVRLLTVAITTAVLSSCSTVRPLPVKEPKTWDDANISFNGLGPPKTVEEGKRTVRAYENAYTLAAEDLYGNNYKASDATFSGGVLGMAGGLTKSPETAILGALLSGGGGITAQRYAFLIQASNYSGAADSMHCLGNVLEYANADEVEVPYLNERIDDIRRKLRKYQSKIDIGSADLATLQTALKAQIDAKRESDKADKDVDEAKANKMALRARTGGEDAFSVMVAEADQAIAIAEQTALEKAKELNRAELLKCTAAY